MSEQKYRPLKAGEIISNGDQYQDVCGNWIGYPARRFGEPISELAIGRRPVAGETETVEEQPEVGAEPPVDRTPPTLAARLQNSLDDAICCNMNLQAERDKLQAELAASQRMYLEAMTALEREVMMHRETNGTLDEVCRERDALQEQLKERAGEPRKSEILDFIGVQIAVIPYLQAAVGKDAQRELTIAGRTLQMVHAAIESDRIGRDSDGKEANGGK